MDLGLIFKFKSLRTYSSSKALVSQLLLMSFFFALAVASVLSRSVALVVLCHVRVLRVVLRVMLRVVLLGHPLAFSSALAHLLLVGLAVGGHEEQENLLELVVDLPLLLLAGDEVVPKGVIRVHRLDEVHLEEVLALLELKKLGQNGLSLGGREVAIHVIEREPLARRLSLDLSKQVSLAPPEKVVAKFAHVLIPDFLESVDVQLANEARKVVVLEVLRNYLREKGRGIMDDERQARVAPGDDVIAVRVGHDVECLGQEGGDLTVDINMPHVGKVLHMCCDCGSVDVGQIVGHDMVFHSLHLGLGCVFNIVLEEFGFGRETTEIDP